MRELTLQEAFKIIDLSLEDGNSLKNVMSTMAIENMFVSEGFLMELILQFCSLYLYLCDAKRY